MNIKNVFVAGNLGVEGYEKTCGTVVVNDKVVSMGKVLKVSEIEELLHKLGF